MPSGRCPHAATSHGRRTDQRLARRRIPRDNYRLVVAHTHGHGDHVDGDEQFADRPDTTIVAKDPESVARFFGFSRWPERPSPSTLGGRVLEVTGNPGHHPAAIAIYDAWTGFLLTGDTVYPGRLYVSDIDEFVESLDALVEITESRRRQLGHGLSHRDDDHSWPGLPDWQPLPAPRTAAGNVR